MADPAEYTISYSFSNFEANNPSSPPPGDELDQQFQDIENSIGELVAAVMDIRRSDGGLHDGIVGPESLSSELLTGIAPPTSWVTATAYEEDETVFNGPKFYMCLVDHTSGVFATDLAAAKWEELADFTPLGVVDANTVVYDNAVSALVAEDVQAAIDEIVDMLDDYADTPVELAELGADVTIKLMPAGVLMPYAGAVAPSGWLLCYGQSISRTTYAALFSALGTVHGVGNGTTTFNIPDMRGRAVAGKDSMGGASSNRLSGASGGVDGDVLGAVGGAEVHTLTSNQLASHVHSASTSVAGTHTHPDTFRQTAGAATSLGASASASTAEFDQVSGPSGAHEHVISVGSAGSNHAHNNVQPTIIMNYIIFSGVA